MKRELAFILAVAASTAGFGEMKVVRTFHFDPARESFRDVRRTVGDFVRNSTAGGLVEVVVKNGEYFITRQLELTGKDAGTTNNPVVWRAETDGGVILNGGVPVKGFRRLNDAAVLNRLDPKIRKDMLVADLKAAGVTNVNLWGTQLVQGKIQTLARYPNEGYMNVGAKSNAPRARDEAARLATRQFVYDDKRVGHWEHEKWFRVTGFLGAEWCPASYLVKELNVHTRTIVLPPRNASDAGVYNGARWFGENLLCELDVPGEYYVDPEAARVYYAGDRRNREPVYLTAAANLFKLTDLQNVSVRGFVFKNSQGYGLMVWNCRNVAVSDCRILNCRRNGAEIMKSSGVTVKNTEIGDTFKCGVYVKGCWNVVLEKLKVHDVGRGRGSLFDNALDLNRSGATTVRNCEICNCFACAISGIGPQSVIEGNFIHDVSLESSDCGAIHSWRARNSRSRIVGNVIKNVPSFPGHHSNPVIYLDDDTYGFTIGGNRFVNAKTGVFASKYNTVVEGNEFIDVETPVFICGPKVKKEDLEKPEKTVIRNNRTTSKSIYRGDFVTDAELVVTGNRVGARQKSP